MTKPIDIREPHTRWQLTRTAEARYAKAVRLYGQDAVDRAVECMNVVLDRNGVTFRDSRLCAEIALYGNFVHASQCYFAARFA